MSRSEIISIIAVAVALIIGIIQIWLSRKQDKLSKEVHNLKNEMNNISGTGIIGSTTGNITGTTIIGKQR